MRRIILTFGAIAGSVLLIMIYATMPFIGESIDFGTGEWLGYISMVIALSTIFIGIKSYRDKELNGIISFGGAFKTGLLITLVASVIYVCGWMIYSHYIMPDFMDKYSEYSIEQLRNSGESEKAIQIKIAEMDEFKEMYKNPFIKIAFTFLEIFPVGLLISLIAAAFLKKKDLAPVK